MQEWWEEASEEEKRQVIAQEACSDEVVRIALRQSLMTTNSLLALEDVGIDGYKATTNNHDNNQPYREKIKPSLGSQPLVNPHLPALTVYQYHHW